MWQKADIECCFSCGLFWRGYWPWSGFVMLVTEDTGIWMLEVEEIPGSFIHPVDIWVHTPVIHLPLPRAPLLLSSTEDLSILTDIEREASSQICFLSILLSLQKSLTIPLPFTLTYLLSLCISDIPFLGSITSMSESYSEKPRNTMFGEIRDIDWISPQCCFM